MPLDIAEYRELPRDNSGRHIAAGWEPAAANQQLTVGAEVKSAAFGDQTRFVRLHTDVACRIAFGANPTATSASMRMAAGQTEFFGVYPGHKVSVITST